MLLMNSEESPLFCLLFFFSSRRRHTRWPRDWSSDVCSSDLQSTVLRSLVLAPYLVSNVVAAIVFLWILDTQLGIFNVFLQWIGFDPVAFWASETWVIPKLGRASCRDSVTSV